ncbi:MAG: hypothetical protein OHK0026_02670 [Rhodocyclaceae bacterium]
MSRIGMWVCALAFALQAGYAAAAATVRSAVGDVKVVSGAAAPVAVSKGQTVASGATIATGDNGRAILRFDDGQVVALHGNTSFRIDEFRFEAARPEAGSAFFSLLKGAIRAVTGLIGQRNARLVAFRTPQATIGIRGTDFMMAIVNPLYLNVISGGITAENAGGTAAFGAGQFGTVQAMNVPATTIPGSALPAGVATAFSQLAGMELGGLAGGAASGAGAGEAGAAAGIGSGAGIAIGAGVAAGLAIGGGGGGGETPAHTTSSHH